MTTVARDTRRPIPPPTAAQVRAMFEATDRAALLAADPLAEWVAWAGANWPADDGGPAGVTAAEVAAECTRRGVSDPFV